MNNKLVRKFVRQFLLYICYRIQKILSFGQITNNIIPISFSHYLKTFVLHLFLQIFIYVSCIYIRNNIIIILEHILFTFFKIRQKNIYKINCRFGLYINDLFFL